MMRAMPAKTMGFILWMSLLFNLILIVHFCGCSNIYLPCLVSHDSKYNGRLVDCSNCGLSSSDIFTLESRNVSTLILSKNDIRILKNNSFLKFDQLKRLECSSCGLKTLEVNALKGRHDLEVLILNNNSLAIMNRSFPVGFFAHVPRLKILDIGGNQNGGYASNYSQFIDIFDTLRDLTQLDIDSFTNLRIGSEFSKLKNLSRLAVRCDNTKTISDESFAGFDYSDVQHLYMIGNANYVFENQDCDGLFQHLPKISSLIVQNMLFGNGKLLKMLKPLENRHFDLIRFDNVGIYHRLQKEARQIFDRIITDGMVRYLKYICVTNFEWFNSYIVSFEFNEMTSHTWRHCLKAFTSITGGPSVTTDSTYVLQLSRLEVMKSFVSMSYENERAVDFWKQKKRDEVMYGLTDEMTDSKELMTRHHKDNPSIAGKNKIRHFFQRRPVQLRDPNLLTNPNTIREHSDTIVYDHFRDFGNLSNHSILLPNLTDLVLDDVESFSLDVNITTLRHLSLRNSVYGCSSYSNSISGSIHLESIDFTNSYIGVDPLMFQKLPSLKRLLMRGSNTNPKYLSQVANNVPNLEYFDIADNNLQSLPTDMFRYNRNLKYLCLAFNRFDRLPFDLSLTPNLEILDLRENSLAFSPQDRHSLERHLYLNHMDNFTILIGSNQISCVCSSLPFLKWLHESQVHFDQDRNYMCTTEDGSSSQTSKFSNVKKTWRTCHGQTFFLISLICALCLLAFLMTTFLATMHQTRIISKLLQIFVPKFRLKSRQDCSLDVAIGYADQDGDFIRYVLLPYLEDGLGLERTFVHQRDMTQDPQSMSHAIRDSWRTLLVITEDFLDRTYMAHNVMKVASFFVHPSNPQNVVVMVEERVLNRIPDFVLQVVDEDSIIVIPELPTASLGRELSDFLKTRLLQ